MLNRIRIPTDGSKLTGHGCLEHQRTRRAFTLIEMIGVLAVIALLAVAVIGTVIKRVDMAASTKEKADLDAMAESFTQFILRNKSVPGYANMPATIANELALPLNAITTNPRNHARAFLVDSTLSIGGAGLPYNQTNNGATSVTNARIMIVSSLHRDMLISSGANMSPGDFQVIWDTPEGAIPSAATWSGFKSSDDVHIKKLNLEPLFRHLVLVNREPNASAGFSIDSTNAVPVMPGPYGVDAYYLDGSVVGLHDATGVPVTKYLLNRDISFVFERNQWQGWIGPGDPNFTTSDQFVQEARDFLASGWNTQAKRGSSQTGVLVTMYVFMFDYALWAEECPWHFDWHGLWPSGNPQNVPEYAILDALGRNQAGGILFDASENLLNDKP